MSYSDQSLNEAREKERQLKEFFLTIKAKARKQVR